MDVVLLVDVTEILGRHRIEKRNRAIFAYRSLCYCICFRFRYPSILFRLLRFVYKYLLSGKGKVESQHMNLPLRNLNVNCNHLSVPHQLFLALGLSLVDKALNILL